MTRFNYSWIYDRETRFCFGIHFCNHTACLYLGPLDLSFYYGKKIEDD